MYTEIETDINALKSKLPEETSAIVSTDFISVLSKIKSLDESLNEKKQEVEKLEEYKNELLKTNGELFRKLGEQITEKPEEETTTDEPEEFDISTVIDEKGNII